MAKIPDYTSLSRVVPQVDGNIDTRGVGANISTGLMDVAQASSDVYRRKTDLQMAKAKANFSIALIAEESALDKDPDFNTYGQRFNENIQKKIDAAAGLITDGAARNQFMADISTPLAVTAEKVRNKAAIKETEFERGELTTTLNTMRDAAITSGDIAGFNAGASNLVSAMVEAGHVSADDAEKIKINYRNDLSVGYLSTLEPPQRLEALKTVKPYLPADKYAEIERDAKNEVMKIRAQAFSQQVIDSGLTYEQAMNKAKEIKDPMERAITEQDTGNAYRQNEAINQAEQQDIMTTWYDLQTGTNGERVPAAELRKQHPEQWDKLTREQKKAINAEEASLTTGKEVPYNDDAELKLNTLFKSGNKTAAFDYYKEIRHALSVEQKRRWNDNVTSGLTPRAADLGDGIQYISKLNMDKEDANQLSQKYINWHNSQAEPPSRAKTNEWIDEQLLKVSVPGEFFGTNEVEAYKVTDEDHHRVIVDAFGAEIVDAAYQYLQENKVKPTRENINKAVSFLDKLEKPAETVAPVAVETVEPVQSKIVEQVSIEDATKASLQILKDQYNAQPSIAFKKTLDAVQKQLDTAGSGAQVEALIKVRDEMVKRLKTADTTQAKALESAIAKVESGLKSDSDSITKKDYALMSEKQRADFKKRAMELYGDEFDKVEEELVNSGINAPFEQIFFDMIREKA